ncbi:flagella synthesis protein FlgN [Pseudoduganella chitinolytica]|uniref:Flagellar protein FlgN n=1 Tax=Pseudoduganella chitinolytica TaxID=34070 RepID=A0ABY8BCS2_9BURK|nr:flagellar protein FlgN [Pseudoduganella chitinolytica]WEF33203.1 flagellar protein FlgN [Pseudoduganella chitinolytica]
MNGATTTPMHSLKAEHTLIISLREVLLQEQNLLVAADIDKLDPLTARKAELINEMALTANQRHRSLGAAGFARGEAGMEAWLAAHGSDADKLLWHDVLDQTREAKELNRLNGMLINRQLSHTQGALQALRPQAQVGVYGPSGRTATSTFSRGFVAG